MSLLVIVLGLIVVLTAVIVVVVKRLSLNKESKKIVERMQNITPFQMVSECREDVSKQGGFVDIKTDMENTFKDSYVSFRDEQSFTDYYKEFYYEVSGLLKRLKTLNVEPPCECVDFVYDFENIHSYVKSHNERYIQTELDENKVFFDSCLKYPLDKQQRRSIVSDEDNCLVVSSAGSGKTSSIVGKVKYLIEVKHVNPEKILLISYTNKASAELTERMGTVGLRGYTFHKLAIDIISKTLRQKPLICDNTDSLIIGIYKDLLHDEEFKKSVVECFVGYQLQETESERQENERRQQLSKGKRKNYKVPFLDMDGKTIYVRSLQEQKICVALFSLGVKFRYEQPYEHQLSDEYHNQYRPDFSIYYEHNGETKRLYLEHFGVDEHSRVPYWFAKEKGISYEEANKNYNDGITWKKEVHNRYGTKLLTTSSADFHYYDIRNKLKVLLEAAGVPIKEKTENELYEIILPKDNKQEKVFIRLIATFITLAKSSCKSLSDILKLAENEKDERSEFFLKNIIQPVYERYAKKLKNSNQIDFTDAILQATDICCSLHPVNYDYIIVDEFQDISIDRYNFLKVLRESNTYAKLYCVGDDWQSIYRFSGSDMALFNQFPEHFGKTEINKIETTYRFGEPLIGLASQFILKNDAQINKNVRSFSSTVKTELQFCEYERQNYCNVIEQIVSSIPAEKSIFLLGRYSFDDYYLSFVYKSVKVQNHFFYIIGNRKVEFLTVHKSKGLETDYAIILQCNKNIYGFPSQISDDPVLNYVLTKSDQYPYGEERRLFYVAITRAKIKTYVLYDKSSPSVFVDEFLHPEKLKEVYHNYFPNANKRWTNKADQFLLALYKEGKSVKYIADKMGRSKTSIIMRLRKLNGDI